MTQLLDREASPLEAVRKVVETTAVERVFGSPIACEGLTMIPVARVAVGGGGGAGNAPADGGGDGGPAGGSGGGVGMTAKPLGVFVVRDGDVRWRPVININRVILGGQVVMVAALLTIRTIVKVRSRQRPLRSRDECASDENVPGTAG